MKIISSAFNEGEMIPTKYTCDGENISPPLEFVDVPEETKSLVLIMDDPDAPQEVFTHWIVYKIDPETTSVTEGKNPAYATIGLNSAGKAEYAPPCPPSDIHRYYFRLYALDTEINLQPGANRREIEEAIAGHVIAQAELLGRFGR